MVHGFQPPSSSKRGFIVKHNGAHRVEDLEFWTLLKPEIRTLQDVLPCQVISRKLNVALSRSSPSQMTFKLGALTDFANFTGK